MVRRSFPASSPCGSFPAEIVREATHDGPLQLAGDAHDAAVASSLPPDGFSEALRSELQRRGRRFEVDVPVGVRAAEVRPHISFGVARVAVFIHGSWLEYSRGGGNPTPSERNPAQKDDVDPQYRENVLLKRAGWIVIRVSEHEPVEIAANRVESVLNAVAVLHAAVSRR